jgi:hypothetical protein
MAPQGKPFERSENMACSLPATLRLPLYFECTSSLCAGSTADCNFDNATNCGFKS